MPLFLQYSDRDFTISLFPILDRRVFEDRLHLYFQDPTRIDIPWSALLNTVLASGCRVVLSAETPDAFERSGREGWDYFQNAVDLIAQLLYKPSNITVVQVHILTLVKLI